MQGSPATLPPPGSPHFLGCTLDRDNITQATGATLVGVPLSPMSWAGRGAAGQGGTLPLHSLAAVTSPGSALSSPPVGLPLWMKSGGGPSWRPSGVRALPSSRIPLPCSI